MSNSVIIVAGGSGTRMKAGIPKQFMLLNGKPVLMHTIEKFFAADASLKIIVVLPESEIKNWKSLCVKHDFKIPHATVEGGETRFHSVKNGLTRISEKGIVCVHDGVRPLVSAELIQHCIAEAKANGNAVPCISVPESIRKINGDGNAAADRNSFVLIQTPQCFDADALKRAYANTANSDFTDDASLAEASGEKIHLVKGERTNIKITYPDDVLCAEALSN